MVAAAGAELRNATRELPGAKEAMHGCGPQNDPRSYGRPCRKGIRAEQNPPKKAPHHDSDPICSELGTMKSGRGKDNEIDSHEFRDDNN